MPPETVRPLALVAMLGGASYVLSGVVQLASPEQADPFSRASDNLIQILLALHVRQAGNYGGPRGWTGFRAAAVASFLAGGSALSFLYTVGVLVLLAGLALLSVATYRAAILPHWTAYLVAA